MVGVLAQLTGDEVGIVRMAIAVFSTLFLGLVGWVGWYMRRQSERVDEHVTTLAVHAERMGTLRTDLDEACDRITDLEQKR